MKALRPIHRRPRRSRARRQQRAHARDSRFRAGSRQSPRDAVHLALDVPSLLKENETAIALESAAQDRAEYLRRPDLGRRLNDASKAKLKSIQGPFDVAFVIADGLSALAVHNRALAVLAEVNPLLGESWKIAPLTIVRFGRVAIADEIGSALNAALSVILIGERPGLSSPDSLGIYLTWNPHPGRVSTPNATASQNIHAGGLNPCDAAAACWPS